MNRRTFLLGSLATAVVPAGVAAQDSIPAICLCPSMEERDGVLVFEGQGNRLSEGFELEEGRYRVELEFTYQDDPDHIGVVLHTPDGDYERIYNDYRGETFASTLIRVAKRGECFLEVEATTVAWKIGISPV